jgi:hypothetical protein
VFRRREIAAVLFGDVADTWDIGAIKVELAIAVAVVPLPRSADIRWFVARFLATSTLATSGSGGQGCTFTAAGRLTDVNGFLGNR